MAENAPASACLLVAVGALFFSLMGLAAKLAQTEGDMTPFSLLAVRSLIGLIPNLSITFVQLLRDAKGVETWKTLTPANAVHRLRSGTNKPPLPDKGEVYHYKWAWLGVRSLAGFGCVSLEYAALKVLPLKVNAMIIYSSPAFIVLWAALLLQHPVSPMVLAFIGLSFCGVMLEVQPWSHNAAAPIWAYAAAFCSSILAGLVYVSLRALAGTSYLTVMNTFLISSLVLSTGVGFALGAFHLPAGDARIWAYLVMVGLFAYLAEVCVTCGYQRAKQGTGQAAVMKFLSPVFSLLWGFLLLGEALDWLDFAGATLIIGSSVGIVTMQQAEKKVPSLQADSDDNPAAAMGDNPNAEIEIGDETNDDTTADMEENWDGFCSPKADDPAGRHQRESAGTARGKAELRFQAA